MSRQAFKFCFCFERIFKQITAEPPEDVKQLFKKYSVDGTMSIENLLLFMKECQGEDQANIEDAQKIFLSLKHLNIFHRRGLHLDAFFRYLLGNLNPPLPDIEVHHDMSAPLSHYFLFTGHNSYLTGNQITSDCSIQPIIRALKRGVRVIELDLWPNSKGNGVKVCHGGTLTKSVELIQCLRAIKDHAFATSEYPVIITFEDHLDAELQAIVAQMVIGVFGKMLFRPPSKLLIFPSPDSLKGRILISTKLPKETPEAEKEENDVLLKKKNPSKKEKLQETGIEIQIDNKNELDDDEEEENKMPEYKSLIAIHAVKLKGGVKNKFAVDSYEVRRLSLSEQQLKNAIEEHGTDIVRFTQQNLLRIYPKGSRVTSSNYNPMIGWTYGAQMVAINMQGCDKYLWITEGMFRANGNCGYVKKPDFLLNADRPFDPTLWRPVTTILKVKVYMGHGWHLDFHHTYFDRLSPPDFFTKLHIFGVPRDEARAVTRPIEDQWIPAWNHEFDFPLTVPELALLQIEVREFDPDRRHEFAGQTCLPISELKRGIRAVPLYNEKGEKYRSVKLLLGFELISLI